LALKNGKIVVDTSSISMEQKWAEKLAELNIKIKNEQKGQFGKQIVIIKLKINYLIF